MKPISKVFLKLFLLFLPSFCYKECFFISDFFWNLGDLLLVQKNKVHPKHSITKYSKYFLKNIKPEYDVLDLGCGIGFTSKKIAEKANHVLAIDFDKKKISQAKTLHNAKNLRFSVGNIYYYKPIKKYDVAVLSNVLEHLEHRKKVLKKIRGYAKKLIIRVPNIERDWYTVFKKNNSMEYRSDLTHTIEHDFATLKKEVREGGWKIIKSQFAWGEIWCVCVPLSEK